MNATLTYCNPRGEAVATFELDSPVTVVGRRPHEILDLPGVAEQLGRKEPFQARLWTILFIVIPGDLYLARRHFAIRRADDGGFLVRDLHSTGGFRLNGVRNPGAVEVPLNDGDRIQCGSDFVFNLGPGKTGVRVEAADPEAAPDQPRP
jgi:hypothetical protein